MNTITPVDKAILDNPVDGKVDFNTNLDHNAKEAEIDNTFIWSPPTYEKSEELMSGVYHVTTVPGWTSEDKDTNREKKPNNSEKIKSLEKEVNDLKEKIAKLEQSKHTIKKGDTLYGIAQQYNTTVDKIMELNGHLISDKNNIEAGWVLRVK